MSRMALSSNREDTRLLLPRLLRQVVNGTVERSQSKSRRRYVGAGGKRVTLLLALLRFDRDGRRALFRGGHHDDDHLRETSDAVGFFADVLVLDDVENQPRPYPKVTPAFVDFQIRPQLKKGR